MPNLAHLEAICVQLGRAKGHLGAILGHLEAALSVLGPSWGRLGAVLGPSWRRLGANNLQKITPLQKDPKQQIS